MSKATVTGLYVYPIKSCGALEVKRTKLAEFGLMYDREWVIVDAAGTVLTQRDKKPMTLIQPQIDDDGTLTLSAPHMIPLRVQTLSGLENARNIEVWGNACAGFDQGDEVAQWLSDYLQISCRLLRNDKGVVRLSNVPNNEHFKPRVAFADSMPYLVISEESLDDLNNRLPEPVSMGRFRPSIVIKGLGPFAEDSVEKLYIAGVTLIKTKPCARCVIVTIEQSTGELKGPEPLRTLSEYRRAGEKVNFGYYFADTNSPTAASELHSRKESFSSESEKWLSIGDEVRVI